MTHRRVLPVHYFDPGTGIYQASELLPGWEQENGDYVYRVPTNATFENPAPVKVKGEVAVFNEKERRWYHIKDHRGEIWFDYADRPVQIVRPGDPNDWKLAPVPRNARTA